MKKFCVLIVLNTFITLVLSGQCPDRDFLWKRLVYIRDSSSLISSSSEQLRELLGYESAITNCTYQYDSTHALLLQRIGVLYLLAEDYARATQFILESIHLYDKKKDKPGINSNELIRSYYILARIYGSLNLISAKMAAFDSCIAIRARTRSVDAYSLYSFKEKVEYLFDIGDYQRVINTAEMGESLIDQYTNEEERVNYAINFLTWKVNALLEFKDYRKAEKLIRSKIDDCRKTGAEEYLGNLYEQLAKVCVQKGSFHESEIFFQEALKYHQRDKYYLGCEQTLNNLGYSLYFRQYNDYNKAILTYKKALGYLSYDKSDSREYSIEALNTYANIGNAFGWKGDYDSSFYYFQLAFDQVKPGITEKDLIKNSLNEVIQFKKIRQIMALLLNKGDTYFRQYSKTGNKSSIEKAIHIYKLADQFGDAINKGQTEISSQLLWRGSIHSLYEHAIEACYLTGNIDDAFYFFEKGRATLLNDQLIRQNWAGTSNILKQAVLKRRIVQLERESSNPDISIAKLKDNQEEIFTKKHELDEVLNKLKLDNPFYYQNYLDTNLLSVELVRQKLLKTHQGLVEFFSGDSAIYLIVVTAAKADLTKIDKASYDSAVRLFNSYISDKILLNKNYDHFLSTGRFLYNLLFDNNPVPDGRIIISPDGYYFPMEALSNGDRKTPNYFLNNHAVSYSYSARYLINEFDPASNGTFMNFLGLAPVKFSESMQLSELPGSDISLNKMQSYFSNSERLVGGKATRSSFLHQFYNYKVIQIYSHASDNSMFEDPVIYFSDSALYLSDLIGDRKPVADLIILSACETGLGKLYKGEGVFGFNRGFAALGVPSTITNLWAVDDKPTYILTELVNKYISQKEPLDIALQKAKLQVLNGDYRLPYFWAAPILMGKTNPVKLNDRTGFSNFLPFIGLMGLSLLIGLVWRSQKK